MNDSNKLPLVLDENMKTIVKSKKDLKPVYNQENHSLLPKKFISSIIPLEPKIGDIHDAKIVRNDENFPKLKEVFVVKGNMLNGFFGGYIIQHDRDNKLYTITNDNRYNRKICFHYKKGLKIVEPSLYIKYIVIIENNFITGLIPESDIKESSFMQYNLLDILVDGNIEDIEKGIILVSSKDLKNISKINEYIESRLNGLIYGIKLTKLSDNIEKKFQIDRELIIKELNKLDEQGIVYIFKNAKNKDIVMLKKYQI